MCMFRSAVSSYDAFVTHSSLGLGHVLFDYYTKKHHFSYIDERQDAIFLLSFPSAEN